MSNCRANLLRFNLSTFEISQLTDNIIDESRKLQDHVASLPQEERSFKSVVLALNYDESSFLTLSKSCVFPSYVSPVKEVRDAANGAKQKISEFSIESGMRQDVYEALKTVNDKEYNTLNSDEQRLLSRMIRDFERNGLGLSEQERSKVKELKEKLSKICIQFQKNLTEDQTKLYFSEEELEGCTQDFIQGLSKNDSGMCIVSLKPPEIMAVMQYAKRPETRKKLDYARSSQCQQENVPLFEDAIKIRRQIAKLLGFDTHADFVLDIRMAKNKQNVLSFLDDLRDRLTQGGHQELEKLKQLKKQNEYETDPDQIHSYDYLYYDTRMKEVDYQLDDSLIQQYFPFDSTFAGLLNISQELFGLRFEQVHNAEVWYQDVRMYNVFDAETEQFIGQFYLDMFPRDGKYNHFCAVPLQVHYFRADNAEQHPVAAMLCNFPKPTASKPSLLKHSDVVTLFHEFGHLQHNFCSKAKYGRFSGTSVERDFVELPSQFMENYCYEVEALKTISQHYQTGDPLSDDLIKKIIDAKNAGVALFNLRQLFFGIFDMTVHTTESEEIRSEELFSKLRKEVSLIPNQPGTNPSANFGHLISSYDAGYYSYLYSEVFSVDMFDKFQSSGSVFNKNVGKAFRQKILEVGGMRDGSDMLRGK
jgi:thimet oligopeptidase